MYTVHLDTAGKGIISCLQAKQNDVGRKFCVIITDGGVPVNVDSYDMVSIWFDGAAGSGNYSEIGDSSAISIDGNKLIIEILPQMIAAAGCGKLCVVLNNAEGDQLGLWNIPYSVEGVPGANSEKMDAEYTAFYKTASDLAVAAKAFTPDTTLSIAGSPADAAATGKRIAAESASLNEQIATERSRIDEIVATRGTDAQLETIEFADDYISANIVSNGTSAALNVIVTDLQLGAGEFHLTEFFIGPSVCPVCEVTAQCSEQELIVTIQLSEPNDNGNVYGRLLVRNATAGEISVQSMKFYAMYPLRQLAIAEMSDLRVAADGTTYQTAGVAVREQFKVINDKVNNKSMTVTLSGDEKNADHTAAQIFEHVQNGGTASLFHSNGEFIALGRCIDGSALFSYIDDEGSMNIYEVGVNGEVDTYSFQAGSSGGDGYTHYRITVSIDNGDIGVLGSTAGWKSAVTSGVGKKVVFCEVGNRDEETNETYMFSEYSHTEGLYYFSCCKGNIVKTLAIDDSENVVRHDFYYIPQVDASLTEPGYAADAEKVGDRFDTVEKNIGDISTALDRIITLQEELIGS